MGWLSKLFGQDSLSKSQQATKMCKAYKNGRCISQQTGADTGPCSWRPSDWQNCGVVDECKKFYGQW